MQENWGNVMIEKEPFTQSHTAINSRLLRMRHVVACHFYDFFTSLFDQ